MLESRFTWFSSEYLPLIFDFKYAARILDFFAQFPLM